MSLLLSKHWNSLTKPSNIKKTYQSNCGNIASISVYPLENGMGDTLGNALRRVLLSSLRGFAISKIKIQGVNHEFDTITGVKEDVVDIIFNLKKLVISSENADKKVFKINAIGPCTVTGADISTNNYDAEIINKDLVICSLDAGAILNMDLFVESGKGYVALENKIIEENSDLVEEDNDVGAIKLDCSFSPIKKVFYSVEGSRVGNDLSYDKMNITIESNGSVDPEQALGYASKILQDQLSSLINFDDVEEEDSKEEENSGIDIRLLKKVDELELSVRSQNCLKNEDIMYIGDLVCKTEQQMLRTPNFGRKSLNELKVVLNNMGLNFSMKIEGWPPENLDKISIKESDSNY